MFALGGLGPTIIAVMWIETILGCAFVGLRVYCRTALQAKGGWDDIFMVASAFLLLMYTIFCTIAATYGFGQHFALLTLDEFVHANQMEIVGQTFCIIGIATSKAGVAAFQLRIFEKLWQRLLLIGTATSVIIICVLVALFDFIRCNPVAAVWNPTITDAQCFVSTEAFTLMSITLSIISAAADFIFAILPWIVIWRLQMRKNTKILICCAMSLGVFAGVCGIVRAIALEGLSARSDYSYETVGLILWSSTELVVTIITACIPTYRELWVNMFGSATLFSRSGRSYSRSKGQKNSIRLEEQPQRSNNSHRAWDASKVPGKVRTDAYYLEDDEASDRGILRQGSQAEQEGIKMTNDFSVTVENRDGTKMVGKEMD